MICRSAGNDEWPIGVSHYQILGVVGTAYVLCEDYL